MRVTARSDYALRALVELGRRESTDPGVPVTAEELGRAGAVPHGFLLAILADLRRSGIVVSQRGQCGGWRLTGPASSITVADVLRAVDGPLVSVHDVRPEQVDYPHGGEVVQHVWIAVRAALRRVAEQVTVADLAAGALPPGVEGLTRDEGAWTAR